MIHGRLLPAAGTATRDVRAHARRAALALLHAVALAVLPALAAGEPPAEPRVVPGAWNVIVFVADDCPISNRYAPQLERIRADAERGLRPDDAPELRFLLVYAGPHVDAAGVAAHREAYALGWPAALDPDFALADRLQASVTPEAVVVAPDGEIVYRGRIDDRYEELGRYRPTPRTRDLEAVLGLVAAGERPEPRVTRAVGCFIRGALP